ncbi:ankyrin repeat-containing domain protein [Dunaliella salina]|uniref:Ankyrin repeat-containing domain protein n=1 Tax=Dunaliella salina TaxID=3046 RepID=A0ABQ7GSU7_DUNSA|nr:ankyrin repeat-containing domain protein [Dunaliella salina]|eukprot:KAF5837651.1 ankyrin repeat-containing domain protein [Dunaliella salina]
MSSMSREEVPHLASTTQPCTSFDALPAHVVALLLSYLEDPCTIHAFLYTSKAAQAYKHDPMLTALWLCKHRAGHALQLATCCEEAVMLHMLRTCGVCPTGKDEKGMSPLHYAATAGHATAIQFLRNIGVPIDGAALRLASQAGQLEAVRVCLSAAPHVVDEADDSSYTALHYAAFEGHADVVQVLVSQANANIFQETRSGYNALHFASTNKHARTQQILLHAGMPQGSLLMWKGFPLERQRCPC